MSYGKKVAATFLRCTSDDLFACRRKREKLEQKNSQTFLTLDCHRLLEFFSAACCRCCCCCTLFDNFFRNPRRVVTGSSWVMWKRDIFLATGQNWCRAAASAVVTNFQCIQYCPALGCRQAATVVVCSCLLRLAYRGNRVLFRCFQCYYCYCYCSTYFVLVWRLCGFVAAQYIVVAIAAVCSFFVACTLLSSCGTIFFLPQHSSKLNHLNAALLVSLRVTTYRFTSFAGSFRLNQNDLINFCQCRR